MQEQFDSRTGARGRAVGLVDCKTPQSPELVKMYYLWAWSSDRVCAHCRQFIRAGVPHVEAWPNQQPHCLRCCQVVLVRKLGDSELLNARAVRQG